MGRMGKIQFIHSYHHIISLENLLLAWQEFAKGKRGRKDVQEFERNLMRNIIALHCALAEKTYAHALYEAFKINDPKPRDIHKATVRDRVLHRALYRQLYPFFDQTFIADSYSCRMRKGTHKALHRFQRMVYTVSKNNTRQCFVLKCDIRKFFASIDHRILLNILQKYIPDKDILWLIFRIVDSFHLTRKGVGLPAPSETRQAGLPLGNLTSQLFVNIYMNEFDQFVKHTLKARYYIRYADDFVIFSHDKQRLTDIMRSIAQFLRAELSLTLHPNKVSIQTIHSGVDFLGWVHFSAHRVLRTTTKRRMLKKIRALRLILAPRLGNVKASLSRFSRTMSLINQKNLSSYEGLLSHGNAQKLKNQIHNIL